MWLQQAGCALVGCFGIPPRFEVSLPCPFSPPPESPFHHTLFTTRLLAPWLSCVLLPAHPACLSPFTPAFEGALPHLAVEIRLAHPLFASLCGLITWSLSLGPATPLRTRSTRLERAKAISKRKRDLDGGRAACLLLPCGPALFFCCSVGKLPVPPIRSAANGTVSGVYFYVGSPRTRAASASDCGLLIRTIHFQCDQKGRGWRRFLFCLSSCLLLAAGLLDLSSVLIRSFTGSVLVGALRQVPHYLRRSRGMVSASSRSAGFG